MLHGSLHCAGLTYILHLPACRCPLELHHTVLQGSRTFKCSLVYQPGPGQLVTVMVQEVGRRWG